MFLLPPMMFSRSFDESGRVTEVAERILFPGGAILVYKHPIYGDPKWCISIRVHNLITCEEDLLAYVNSRMRALNELLSSINADDNVQVTVTFKEPLKPIDFKNLYENYFAESGGGPNHSAKYFTSVEPTLPKPSIATFAFVRSRPTYSEATMITFKTP